MGNYVLLELFLQDQNRTVKSFSHFATNPKNKNIWPEYVTHQVILKTCFPMIDYVTNKQQCFLPACFPFFFLSWEAHSIIKMSAVKSVYCLLMKKVHQTFLWLFVIQPLHTSFEKLFISDVQISPCICYNILTLLVCWLSCCCTWQPRDTINSAM